MNRFSQLLMCFFLLTSISFSQAIQESSHKNFSIGTYGRIGANWSFDVQGSVARQFNLNGMGMLGGRLEENDYLEFAPAVHFNSNVFGSKTKINMQMRLAAYSSYGQLLGNVTSNGIGGLTLALNELFVQANNINGSPWSVWVGARLYRGGDIHIADHWYFDDYSGQGFGVQYKNTEFTMLFVGTADTTSTLPPYFYVNTATGTPSLELRQRIVTSLVHTFQLNDNHKLRLLGEFHKLADASADDPVISPYADSVEINLNYPSDFGFAIGLKHMWNLSEIGEGSFNDFSIRFGSRIANGGDGGMSRTWLTYGAPNFETEKFGKAYSLALTEHFLLNLSENFSLNGYMTYTRSHGAADSDHKAKTYFGREVFNAKSEYAIGFRTAYYFSEYFHLINEIQHSARKDGVQEYAAVTKFSVVPTFVPTGGKSIWTRPHLRLIYTIAFYNNFAKHNLYSPYLQVAGNKSIGQYLGIRAEWWLW